MVKDSPKANIILSFSAGTPEDKLEVLDRIAGTKDFYVSDLAGNEVAIVSRFCQTPIRSLLVVSVCG
jgi:hypothetical protein